MRCACTASTPFAPRRVTPALLGTGDDPLDVLRSGTVFVSPAAATWLGARPGGTLVVQSGVRTVPLAIAGFAQAEAGGRYAVMDIAAAQDAFDRGGTLSRIDLRLRPGADAGAVRARIAAMVPAGIVVATPADNAAMSVRLSRSYRVNLNVLALVALFTGGLLVFSTQALSIVRRRTQFALLRTLGVSRARLTALLAGEGALVGVAGALVGLAAGYLLADAVLRVFGADLGAGFFRGVAPSVAFEPRAAAVFGALGIAVAVLGSYFPAREAARATPAAALKAGDEQEAFARWRSPLPGLALLAVGAAIAWLPPILDLPLGGYGAIALLLLGTLLLLPRIAALVLQRLPRPRAFPAALALDQLRGAPGQASVSLATIVASVSLMVSMAIMVASFRQSLDDWLLRILPADVYVRAGAAGDSAYFSADDQRRLAAVDGVARSSFLRAQNVALDARQPRVALLARDLPGGDAAAALPLLGDARVPRAGDPPPVYVSEAVVDLYGLRSGDVLQLPLAGQARPFVVAGVWRDYARQQGALVIDRAEYARITGDATATDAAIWLAQDVTVAQFRERVEADVSRVRAALARHARRDPHAVAARVRSHVRRHLRPAGRGDRHRPVRPLVVDRRAGARAAARVRHAAASGDDAAPGGGDARHRRLRRQQHRARRRSAARIPDEPHPHPRREPAIVSLGHGGARAVAFAGHARVGAAAARDRHDGGQRAAGDGPRRDPRREGRLVIRDRHARRGRPDGGAR